MNKVTSQFYKPLHALCIIVYLIIYVKWNVSFVDGFVSVLYVSTTMDFDNQKYNQTCTRGHLY
jgi:hypothetical protein